MKVMCSTVHVALDTVGTAAVTGPLASHVHACSECARMYAIASEYRSWLAAMDHDLLEAPSGLHDEVMRSLGPVLVADSGQRHSLKVPVAAAVVATAAAGTAVILSLRRTRAA